MTMKALPKALLVVTSLLTSVALTHGSLNDDFSNYLLGKDALDKDVVLEMWSKFQQDFSSPAAELFEAQERFQNFENKLHAIVAHNRHSESTYQQGINQYSDMTHEQLREYFRMDAYVADEQRCSATNSGGGIRGKAASDKSIQVPPSWDWRDYGGVSPVKSQSSCGSCWTFSTVGCLESHSLIKYGVTGNYSEQQLVDCAQAFDNNGCNGGLPSHAFEYVESAGGISTETAYPYFATDHNCSVKSSTFDLTVAGGSVNITKGDEEELKLAIFQHGPVSVAFQVVDGFGDYKSGVYTSDTCKNSTKDVNHAVLAVGYGTDEETNLPYWIVKNSWGTKWGDEGFFKIHRGVNMCGIAMCNSYPAKVIKIPKSDKVQEQT